MENYSRNNIIKKNIILIPAEYDGNSTLKGILSLEYYDNKVLGSLRCFNLKKTNEVYDVGIAVGDNIFKTKASVNDLTNLKVQINSACEPSKKVSCVIVSIQNKSYSTLLWGSTQITKANQNSLEIQNLIQKANIMDIQEKSFSKQAEEIIGSVKEKFLQTQSENNAQMILKNDNNYQDENLRAKNLQISEVQEDIFQDELLENYIDKVYAETEQDSNNQSYNYTKPNRENFFSKVSGQVKRLFQNGEPVEQLEKIIPDSKFCKVSNGGEFYVFGIIYENGIEKCLCYGVPSEYSSVPPKELEGYCQWLPVDADNYNGKGYWLTYQDAKTGENISVEII